LDGSATLTRTSNGLHGHFFGQSSFATHALLSARSAVKVDDDLDLSELAPLGCSVQTGAGAVLNVARPEPGSTIVVFGAGGVGLVAVMAAALTPVARVIAVDVSATYFLKKQALAEYTSLFKVDEGDQLLELYEAEDVHMGRLFGLAHAEVFKSQSPLLVADPTVFLPGLQG